MLTQAVAEIPAHLTVNASMAAPVSLLGVSHDLEAPAIFDMLVLRADLHRHRPNAVATLHGLQAVAKGSALFRWRARRNKS